jgi:type IV pilus assembly protein PilN
MARINLLPWREKERERRNKEFIIQMVIVTAIALICAALIWSFYNRQYASQQEANALITQANTALDRDLKEIEELESRQNEIIARMKVIEDLQGTRPIPVHVLDSLTRSVPANLYLTELERKDNILTIKGKADNPNTVTDLVRNIDSSGWMDSSKVVSIVNSGVTTQSTNPDEYVEPSPEDSYIFFEMNTNIVFPEVANPSATAEGASTNG